LILISARLSFAASHRANNLEDPQKIPLSTNGKVRLSPVSRHVYEYTWIKHRRGGASEDQANGFVSLMPLTCSACFSAVASRILPKMVASIDPCADYPHGIRSAAKLLSKK